MTAENKPPGAAYADVSSTRRDAAGSGPRDAAAAAVEALDGSERKLLLATLADSDPVAVTAGLAWL